MSLALTAAICTHQPRADYLAETLASIRAQKGLEGVAWELLIIDNASAEPLSERGDPALDLSWAPRGRIVREERLGLARARFRSFREAEGALILYIDDDNVLRPDYFRRVIDAFAANPELGAVGGKSLPRYETPPPPWFAELGLSLACRDLGDAPLEARWSGSGPREYPDCAPIGAGMGIRRAAYAAYVAAAEADAARAALGRRGADLASGEDNDMVLTLLGLGWTVAYRPELVLEHLIPASRLTQAYLERYAYSSMKTWLTVLDVHGIRPWSAIAPWTAPLRKARAWWRLKPWTSPAQRIRWQSARGLFDGRAALGRV